MMTYRPVNFMKKTWAIRRVVAGQGCRRDERLPVQAGGLEGDFIWHDHKDTDETFIVLEGELRIDFRDGAVTLAAGEMFVVPKGVEHKPFAEGEVKMLLIEPRGVSQHRRRRRRSAPRRTICGFEGLS